MEPNEQAPTAQAFAHDISFCNSSEDQAVVRVPAERLANHGLRGWLDEWVLEPGASLRRLFGFATRALLLLVMAGYFRCDAAPAAGFVPIFNGTNLAGWHIRCQAADREKSFWAVTNEMILCDLIGRPGHGYVWLLTDQEYGDFELQLEFQAYRDSTGNSGVQFRSRFDDTAKGGWLDGPQVDIHPPTPMSWRTGFIYDETREERRWIHPSLKDSTMDPKLKPERHEFKYAGDGDGWNRLTLICRGTRVTTLLNGIRVTDWDSAGVLDNPAHVKHNVGRTGHLALQLHTGDELRIRFRNLLVREL